MADQTSSDQPKTPGGWVDTAWDGSAGQWDSAESYCAACLIDMNPSGQPKAKELCMLPYKEPGGKVNVRGVLAAAGGRGITRVQAPSGVSAASFATAKRSAAKKLIGLYSRMGRTAPASCYRIAGMNPPA